MESTMNNSSQPQFSEATGYFYNQFSGGGLLVFNKEAKSQYEKTTGNIYIGQPIESLPNTLTLTRGEFQQKVKAELSAKKKLRFSLPSCYVDGGNIVLPNDWTIFNGYCVRDDLRISFANFIREECMGGLSYLTQIKKWFWNGHWIVTFDFSSEKPEKVHLVFDAYDGDEVRKVVKEEMIVPSSNPDAPMELTCIQHYSPEEINVDEYVPYDDFLTKYDALDPHCFEALTYNNLEDGIPVSTIVEPVTADNRGRLGRIDVDYVNRTCRELNDDVCFPDEKKDSSQKNELRDFIPRTRLTQNGIPLGITLKKGEEHNWLPLYINVFLWQHRREWLYGQSPYIIGLCGGFDKATYEIEQYVKRMQNQLKVILPAKMKGDLDAQMREIYLAYEEWRFGKNRIFCQDDTLFHEAAQINVKLVTAWNLLNEGHYDKFADIQECLKLTKAKFPMVESSLADIMGCCISDSNDWEQAKKSQKQLSLHVKNMLGTICSQGMVLPDSTPYSRIEHVLVDLDMFDSLENGLWPREKAYRRLHKILDNAEQTVQQNVFMGIFPIFNFDSFELISINYAKAKIAEWEKTYKTSKPEELKSALKDADKSDLEKTKAKLDEETKAKIEAEAELRMQEAMNTSFAHEINNNIENAYRGLEQLAAVSVTETTRIRKILRFIRPISVRTHLIRYAYGNNKKLSGEIITVPLKQIALDSLHEAMEDVMSKLDSVPRTNYVKSGCDKSAVINSVTDFTNFDFTKTYFDFNYNEEGSSGSLHTYSDYIAVLSLLLHEYLLNAVKNSSFLPREQRRIQLDMTASENHKVTVRIQNSFNAESRDETIFSNHGLSLTRRLLEKVGKIDDISPAGNIFNVCFAINLPE